MTIIASKQPDPSSFTPNPALYTNEKREIYLAESPPLQPRPHECIVHVRSNGICGSDLHFWKTGQIGALVITEGHVLGHEGAGEVVWTGSQVTNLKVGDRVAIEPGIPCESCYQCSSGNYNLCPDVEFSGAPPHPGSIRKYHVHPARYLHKMPDSLSYADGALLEPLSVVMHGFERSPIQLGESTVICGAGPIGLVALAVARISGAFPLVVTDIDAARLKFAQEYIPGCIPIQIRSDKTPQEMADIINEAITTAGGDRPRVVYECTGVQSSVITASFVPRNAGEVMVIGVGKPVMNEIPFMHMSMAEVDLKFINRYHNSWPAAMRVLQSGYLDLKKLITHHYKLEEAVQALTHAGDRNKPSIKIHIED